MDKQKLAQVRATQWAIEEDIQSAKAECASMSTRRGAGSTANITRRCRFWPWISSRFSGCGWGKKETQLSVPEVRALLWHLLEVCVWNVQKDHGTINSERGTPGDGPKKAIFEFLEEQLNAMEETL